MTSTTVKPHGDDSNNVVVGTWSCISLTLATASIVALVLFTGTFLLHVATQVATN